MTGSHIKSYSLGAPGPRSSIELETPLTRADLVLAFGDVFAQTAAEWWGLDASRTPSQRAAPERRGEAVLMMRVRRRQESRKLAGEQSDGRLAQRAVRVAEHRADRLEQGDAR